jgi:type VI secretion system protein ImpE
LEPAAGHGKPWSAAGSVYGDVESVENEVGSMTAEEFFQAGRLAEAIQAQNEDVKARPADQDARYLLFVLLCFAGDLERAERQLDVMANQDEKMKSGGLVYRSLLAAELERRELYEKGKKPVLPPDPPPFVELRLAALARLRAGEEAEAETLIDQAVEAAQPVSGTLDGEAFDEIRDYDDILGSVLEVFAGGRYLWLPLERIRSLVFAEPTTAIDTLWPQAQLRDTEGDEARVHVPALYSGSHADADEALKLGRSSKWRERGPLYLGTGQRVMLTAAGGETSEHSLLQVRTLELGKEG